jgi:hypothetical protein
LRPSKPQRGFVSLFTVDDEAMIIKFAQYPQ